MASDDDVGLVVNGASYEGFESIRITRSIESLAGSFALQVSDRWRDEEPWPIAEEDRCRVEIGGETVIDGYIDKRDPSASKESRTLSYSGRDRAAALVDCSLVLKQWTFRNLSFYEFAKTIAAPWGIEVTMQPGLALKKRSKIVVQPGDKAYEALAREAAEDGVLLVSDGAGGFVITRSGAERATSLVEGQNILTASASYSGEDRFYRYVLYTQTAGTDEASGESTRIVAEAIDEGVRRTDRVLLIRSEKGYSAADARRRVDWEARIRAARAETVTITVQGWKQPNGTLWPLNARVRVRAPRVINVDGDMLISQIEHSIADNEGRVTQLRLVRPDAFTPAPTVAKVKKSGGAWKELTKGAL